MAEYRTLLAQARLRLGNQLVVCGQPADGEAVLTQAVPVWEKLRADAPAASGPLVGLAGTLIHLGIAAGERRDHANALAYLDKADRLRAAAPGLMARDPGGRGVEQLGAFYFARTLVNLGDHAAGSARADALAGMPGLGGAGNPYSAANDAFNTACYLARCAARAAKDPALAAYRRAGAADGYAARAVGHLRTAAARGYTDRKAIETDADLAPLRDRKDYKDVLAGLKWRS